MTLKSDFVIKLRDYALMNCSNEKSQGLSKKNAIRVVLVSTKQSKLVEINFQYRPKR